jgi:hypothetical protein
MPPQPLELQRQKKVTVTGPTASRLIADWHHEGASWCSTSWLAAMLVWSRRSASNLYREKRWWEERAVYVSGNWQGRINHGDRKVVVHLIRCTREIAPGSENSIRLDGHPNTILELSTPVIPYCNILHNQTEMLVLEPISIHRLVWSLAQFNSKSMNTDIQE